MESVIGYRFGTLPHQSIHMSSGYNAEITTKPYCFSHFSTKPHLSFSHNSSFSLHKSSRGRPLEHILGPITFTVGHSSTSLTDQKSRLPQAFTAEHFSEVVAVAKELKLSGHKDIAEKLMQIHEPQIDTPGEPADRHCKEKMEILKILIAEGMFPEASKYSADIDSNMSSYQPHLNSDVFKNLKFVILCGRNDHSGANELRKKLEKPPVTQQEQPPPAP
ncbi:hypothetical protein PVL29_013249 [Vitis rotundifolia]|uniref:Uncharacterized protein n=1 Tax=Vitis rotundifolia TaxID=103349 RepID=A0AA38ZKX7_VITRO|nr:hypothetical protein PVL29_013249 [Vitis rotundifolia]